MTKYHTPKYNIPSNINKQTNKQLYHARPCKTKVHICHLCLIRSLALEIPSGVAIVRDVSLKKEIQVPFGAPLFLGKWYGVATYFSLYKKKKKILITKYMTE